jgi:hypothetical protein
LSRAAADPCTACPPNTHALQVKADKKERRKTKTPKHVKRKAAKTNKKK